MKMCEGFELGIVSQDAFLSLFGASREVKVAADRKAPYDRLLGCAGQRTCIIIYGRTAKPCASPALVPTASTSRS